MPSDAIHGFSRGGFQPNNLGAMLSYAEQGLDPGDLQPSECDMLPYYPLEYTLS